MATKYKLFSTPEEYQLKRSEIEAFHKLPDGKGSETYGVDQVMIDNPDHADYGMFIFPVLMEGSWKCDQHFSADELVDYDSSWTAPVDELSAE